jgi:hypothetical protein
MIKYRGRFPAVRTIAKPFSLEKMLAEVEQAVADG